MKGALAALLLGAVPLAAAAGPARLDEAAVGRFIASFDAAERAGDVAAIGAALAADCRVEMRATTEGHELVTALARDEYLADLGDFYASLHDLAGYEYRSEPAHVTLASGAAAASVTRQVTEAFVADGERRAFHIEETTRVELRDGQLAITMLSSQSRAD